MSQARTIQNFAKFAFQRMAWLILLVVVPNTAWAIDITSCPFQITAPGDYFLRQDLQCNIPVSGAAIQIYANNVRLYLNGHTLAGTGIGVGILATGGPSDISGLSIQAGKVTNFGSNILLQQVTDSQIVNVDASGGTGNAIFLSVSFNINVINCTANNTGIGILVVNGSGSNALISNTVNDNSTFGILIDGSSNIVRANSLERNGRWGIQVDGTFNLIQANRVSGSTVFDLSDGNTTCGSDVWMSNRFGTANLSCIN